MCDMNPPQRYTPWLWLLVALFTFRVIAQFTVAMVNVPGLPAFDKWHSGTVPYAGLLAFQVVIVWIMIRQTVGCSTGRVKPNAATGRILWVLGLVYLGVMLLRWLLGLTVMTDSRWFTNQIPTFFHIVLASFVLLVSVYHRQGSVSWLDKLNDAINTVLPWSIYPIVILLGLVSHVIMVYYWGASLVLGTYLPIIAGALIITALEYLSPHRVTWQPNRYDISNDALYMGVVQLLLPKLVALAFMLLLITPIHNLQLLSTTWWPHHWSIGVQAILMILLADFLRYWLHRLAHTNRYLWRLHAVHHSPEKLYWFNVARFHPLEKALQMVFDVLPFMLLGVTEHVIALYYIFYAINGFFQHCNIHLQFGWLNYVISSAHLHRWHHSKLPAESNTNYGNNLIVWDLLFGTYFLPEDRVIEVLGLQLPAYPPDFVHQMIAPFAHHQRQR